MGVFFINSAITYFHSVSMSTFVNRVSIRYNDKLEQNMSLSLKLRQETSLNGKDSF